MSATSAVPDPLTIAVASKATPPWLLPLLPLVSGVLFAYSLPPYQLSWLGWVALVPLLWTAARLPRTLWAAGAGLASGLVAGVVQIGWAGLSGASGHSRNYALAPFIWIACVFMLTAAFAQWARSSQRGWRGLSWVLGVAALGTVAEWLTGFTPLPVGVALGQADNLPLLQIARFAGIWGVSFLLYLANAAVADALLIGLRRKHSGLLPVAVVLFCAVFYFMGLWTLLGWRLLEGHEQFESTQHTAEKGQIADFHSHLEVAAVQDYGGPETATGDPAQGRAASDANRTTISERDASDLMQLAAKGGAKLIVGTENSFGAGFRPDDADDALLHLARTAKTHLVIGHEMGDKATPNTNPFNCATLVGPGGAVGTHHKIHLFLGERQMMQAGDKATVAAAPWGKTGLLICFDTCYTGPTRVLVEEGATIVAVPNYDPPTPSAVLHHLHAALMPFRAVENGVAYVRADPNGLSQIVQPWGEVIALGPMYKNDVVRANVRLGDGRGTFFTRWGDWLPVGCFALLAVTTPSKPLSRLRYCFRKSGQAPDTATD